MDLESIYSFFVNNDKIRMPMFRSLKTRKFLAILFSFFIGASTLFAQVPIVHAADPCVASFYKSGEFTASQQIQTIDTTPDGFRSQFKTPAITNLYVVFPIPATAGTDPNKFDIKLNWNGLSSLRSDTSFFDVRSEVRVGESGGERVLYVRIPYSGARSPLDLLLNDLGPDPQFTAVIDGQQCANSNTIKAAVRQASCDLLIDKCFQKAENKYRLYFTVNYKGLTNHKYYIAENNKGVRTAVKTISFNPGSVESGSAPLEESYDFSPGNKTFCVADDTVGDIGVCASPICEASVSIGYGINECEPDKTQYPPINPGVVTGQGSKAAATGEPNSPKYELCAQIKDETLLAACNNCSKEDANGHPKALWTAVGCIPTSYEGVASSLVKIGLSVAGGAAVLMIVAAGFMLSTSQGEPKRTGEAKELLTSAVIGLLFIIFSVTILQFIGVTILKVPGFGTKDTGGGSFTGGGGTIINNQQRP
jgi:hypothetical protein